MSCHEGATNARPPWMEALSGVQDQEAAHEHATQHLKAMAQATDHEGATLAMPKITPSGSHTHSR